jgi:hypothetical protein
MKKFIKPIILTILFISYLYLSYLAYYKPEKYIQLVCNKNFIIIFFIALIIYYLKLKFFKVNNKNFDYLKIVEEKHIKNERCLNIKMFNENFITKNDLYRSVYLTLLRSKIFIEFTSEKVFISSAMDSSGKIFNLHDNIYFSMDLSLIKFLEKCKHCIEDLDKYNYFDNDILYVTVKV